MGTDELVREALLNLRVVIFYKDRLGRYALINAAGRAVLGRSETEILGRNDFAFFDAPSAETMRTRDRQIALTPEPVFYESNVKRCDQAAPDLFRSAKLAPRGELGGLIGLSVLCAPGEEQGATEIPSLLRDLLKWRMPTVLGILRDARGGAE